MHVVEASICVQVSAVFITRTEAVTSPAVRLTGHPAPALHDVRRPVDPLPLPCSLVTQADPEQFRNCMCGHKVPRLVSAEDDQVSSIFFTPVFGIVPGKRLVAKEITIGLKQIPTQRATAVNC